MEIWIWKKLTKLGRFARMEKNGIKCLIRYLNGGRDNMDRQLVLHHMIVSELKRYEELYELMMNLLTKLPKGSLLNRNGHMYRAFRENGRQFQQPINENKELEQAIKLKFFINRALPILKKKIQNCRAFIQNEGLYDPLEIESKTKNIYQGTDMNVVFLESDMSLENWMDEVYTRNNMPFEKEHFTFKLMNYHKVGLYLGINFFFTWETEDKLLTYQEINIVLNEIEELDR